MHVKGEQTASVCMEEIPCLESFFIARCCTESREGCATIYRLAHWHCDTMEICVMTEQNFDQSRFDELDSSGDRRINSAESAVNFVRVCRVYQRVDVFHYRASFVSMFDM
jgi:hypothetical protein